MLAEEVRAELAEEIEEGKGTLKRAAEKGEAELAQLWFQKMCSDGLRPMGQTARRPSVPA